MPGKIIALNQLFWRKTKNVKGLNSAGDGVGNFRGDIGGAAIYGWRAGKSAAKRVETIKELMKAEESSLVEERKQQYDKHN